ncbi:hypothetical protein M8C21_018912, partial [Ambrosia artemisiifolia]
EVTPVLECIDRIFRKFDFRNESGLLQFWELCMPSELGEVGCNLMLADQAVMSTQDEGLEDYRSRCLESRCRFVGLGTSVGNWLAGRAVQTRIADHRTIHHVLTQEDQHSADVGGKGQLVLPVFYGQGAGKKLLGIIEFVTPVPKESYVEDIEQFHSLLEDEGLKSKYIGKTIKVKYDGDLIKFTLPLSAKLTDLHRKVKTRFPGLENQNLCAEYTDAEGNPIRIASDEDLRVCMTEASSKGAKFIK